MQTALATSLRPVGLSLRAPRLSVRRSVAPLRAQADKDAAASSQQQQEFAVTAALAAAGLLLPLVLDTESAQAVPDLIKGRTFSLIHPAIMIFLFGGSVWAGYLGFQWRRTRELATIIKEKKSLLPPTDAEGKRPVTPLDAEIAELEAERKSLIGQKLNEQHSNWGHLLLGLGVTISVSGAFNTFLRTGKLFPGPHLYAGAAITVLWALASALVPQMQKGNETARNAHIALNTLNIALFAWQLPTGFEIVGKVFEFTSWP